MGLSVGFFNEVDSQFMEVFVLICLFSFVSSFILTQGTIVFVYVPEVIQPPMVTISTVVSWSSAILVTVSFPLIREKSENPSLPQAFLVYSLLAFVTFFICCKWMVETKDKTELEIREEFQALEEWWDRLNIYWYASMSYKSSNPPRNTLELMQTVLQHRGCLLKRN